MREPKSAGRPRQFDLDQTLETIMGLFWARGFDGVSLADLMAVTGLNKASLYKAYGDKRMMYRRALALYEQRHVETAAKAMRAPGDPVQRLHGFLTAPIAARDRGDRRGCFLCNAASEQSALDDQTAAMVNRGFATLEAALAAVLDDIGARLPLGDSRAGAVQALLAIYAGLRVMARAAVDRTRLEAARDAALAPFRPHSQPA